MEQNLQFQHQPGYIKFVQARLSYLVVIFITFYAIALTIAPFLRYQAANSQFAPWQHWIGYFVWLGVFLLVTRLASRLTPNQDPYIIHLIFICCGWGLMMLWRLSPALGIRQTIWFLISSGVFLLILRFPQVLGILKRFTYIWLAGAFFLTALTLLPGLMTTSDQPNLWLTFKGIALQPSEPLKLLFIVYLSAYFSNKIQIRTRSFAVIVPTVIIALAAALILLAQKDLGTVSLLMAIYTVMVFIATGDKKFLTGSVLVFIAAFIAGYFLFDVIRLRITAWIDPWLDPEGRSYQIIQALISQAAGGILGTGPGMGSPNLVPVAASDFIFSAIAEENGLLGAAGVILLILLIGYRGFACALQAKNKFNALLSIGISFWITAQSILIIGGNIRLLPLTGVTLPFFSYGGSSLLVTMIAAGFLTLISGQSDSLSQPTQAVNTYRAYVLPILLLLSSAALLILPVWSFVMKDQLTSRSDNLRRAIADKYIVRGELLDRNGQLIDGIVGTVGDYTRMYQYPPLSATTGYSSLNYGQTGLEMILDPYLRGIISNSPQSLWWSNLLLSHPPPGSNVRLSIDLSLQKLADDQLATNNGAILIMNAQSGELLAVASHPWYDPSKLDTEWNTIIADPQSPLLNRAFDGKYPPGTSLGPFLLGKVIDEGLLLPNGSSENLSYQTKTITCSIYPESVVPSLSEALQNGCPQNLLDMGRLLGKEGIYGLYSDLGFYRYPDFIYPGPQINDPSTVDNLKAASIGQENIHLTPLQLVLAASAISSGGEMPSPILAESYQLPDGSWKLMQSEIQKISIFSPNTAAKVGTMLAVKDSPAWGVVGQALSSSTQTITWFLGGTNSEWQGVPVAFVVLLERSDPAQAYHLGLSMIHQVSSLQQQ